MSELSTMAEVARRAGVSTSTVSRALRGSPLVTPETTARIRLIADELSFAVSRAASSLATGRLGRTAVLVGGSLSSWFNSSLLDAIYSELTIEDQELLIYRVVDEAERAAFFTTMPARRNADALIIAAFALSPGERRQLAAVGLPVVYVNQRVRGSASVAVDDDAGARAGARHLLALGHRDLAFVGLRTRHGFTYSATTREASFRAEALAGGARTITLTAGDGHDGNAVAAEFFGSHLPTAIMTETDELAASVTIGLRDAGVRVPDDVSVIGFDDDDAARLLSLTTIAQPVDELGRMAAAAALQLSRSQTPVRSRLVEPRLVVRRSTVGPRTSEWTP